MIDVEGKIAKTIASRAYRLDFETVYKLIDHRPFYLAGGAVAHTLDDEKIRKQEG